jgi:hypothetical protein
MVKPCGFFALLSALFLLTALWVQAAESQPQSATGASDEDLVKQTQNPVANLISVPFQNNFNFAAGPKHNHQAYLLNIQPVIPINLTDNWNLIARIITPVINLPSLAPGIGSAAGLGDINPTFFLSPAKSGELIWGVGPTFTLPTASDKLLGNGKFSLGPAAVGLMMKGPWVFGALMNNQWSVAGWGDGHVNQFLLQPFVNYNLPDHWYLVSAPIMTANWAAKGSDVWTVPLGGGIGKLFKLGQILPLEGHALGKLPINTQIQAFGNVARPEDGAKWQLRFQIQFLFPK